MKMKLPNGFKLNDLDTETNDKIKKNVRAFASGAYRVTPGNLIVGELFKENYDTQFNSKVYPTDVFSACYPKTGSTWIQEILWAMLHNPNLDSPDSEKHPLEKAPFFDNELLHNGDFLPDLFHNLRKKHNCASIMESHEYLPQPRVLKTHLYFDLLSPELLQKAKFIYTIRNPADACLSYFHFARSMPFLQYQDTLEEFVDDYIKGDYQYGSYCDHLKQWWAKKDSLNLLTVFYEDLRANTKSEMKRIAQFLGLSLSEQQIENVMTYTSFEEMKKRDPMNNSKALEALGVKEGVNFYRKGEVGSSKQEMTPEMLTKINKHFQENLGDVILPYDFSN